ncbi:MAG: 3-dehydro-L-gulonate 2-dehydrogenase [Sediminibacterium sp.]
MTRISFDEMKATVKKAFILAGMPEDRAEICARIHTESSRDGVYSHGLNRVERFVDYIHKGWIDVHATPTLDSNLGALEIYNGHMAPGILNAIFAMNRATEIAEKNGVGLVSLNNTTHWMRGGAYGWLAAEKGYIGICWTNTESCMPAWGATSGGIGNNPFIMAVPRKEGHLVLDMAMSLYSYGKLQVTRLKNQKLPYPGGFDINGALTDDPGAIEESRRILPMGFWKGSGFAILLDVLASLLSGGLSTAAIDKFDNGSCGSCCQVFIAINPLKINTQELIDKVLSETITQIKTSVPVTKNSEIFYPGEQSLKTRHENLAMGIPVDDGVWAKVKELADMKG